ncbi:MAG: hypothetical protein MJ072_00770 [Clostridia bacterium]|nr:hypothetical protein [Clostridia bacterium]
MDMEKIILVFMLVVAFVCFLSILVVIREMIKDSSDRRKNVNQQQAQQVPQIIYVTAPQAQTAPACEQPAKVKEEPAPAYTEPAKEEAVATDSVSFSKENAQTLEDKYKALSATDRKYYDQICKYAAAIENVKHVKNARFEEYKLVTTRLIRLNIKRGVIVCEFNLPNADFKTYISDNKVAVKQAATLLKVTDANAVQVAKDSIDIAVKAFKEEKERKKELAKEKRKALRQAKAE